MIFAASYTLTPLFSSNQNTYFLHGLANGKLGFLANDWMANTTDPFPLFSFLIYLTHSFFPTFFFYGNQYQINRILTEKIVQGIDVTNHRLNVHQFNKMEEEILDLKRSFLPFRYAIALMFLSGLDKVALKVSETQVALDQAAIVAALERYRLVNGGYPESLAALKPEFMAKVPGDLFHDHGLVYRIDEDDSFTLYSTGYNGTDDDGEFFIKGESIDFSKGDWPWPSAAKE